jgi:hypothetical protein
VIWPATQAEAFPRDHRPWGGFETLVLADRFHVKRIVVHPGACLGEDDIIRYEDVYARWQGANGRPLAAPGLWHPARTRLEKKALRGLSGRFS